MITLALDQRRILIESDRGWKFYPDAQYLTSPAGPIIFIVHGYNNDQRQAEESYGKLRENLRQVLGGNRHRLNHIWELYWPGYLPKGALLPAARLGQNLLSASTYPYQERKTEGLGQALADYIRAIPPSRQGLQAEVMFIAHSLGCRVVLETLRHLFASPVRIMGMCLMAAAVPVEKVEARGVLHNGARSPDKTYILYSPNDWVLRRVFRLGQAVAHPTTYPEAVGRFGNPFHGFFDRQIKNVVNTGLGHGDYYTGRRAGSTAPNKTRTTIARLFGISSPNLIQDNYIVEWPSLPAVKIAENHLKTNRLREN